MQTMSFYSMALLLNATAGSAVHSLWAGGFWSSYACKVRSYAFSMYKSSFYAE